MVEPPHIPARRRRKFFEQDDPYNEISLILFVSEATTKREKQHKICLLIHSGHVQPRVTSKSQSALVSRGDLGDTSQQTYVHLTYSDRIT